MPQSHPRRHQRLASAADDALRAWLRAPVAQLTGALQALQAGSRAPEHPHQARVAIRQMRVAWALARSTPHTAPPEVLETLTGLFRALGPCRDRDVMADLLSESLGSGWRAMAMGQEDLHATTDPRQALASAPEVRQTMETLHAWLGHIPDDGLSDSRRWRRHLLKRLTRWHQRLLKDAARFDALDDEAVHAFRKRLKRLRYGLQFARACLPGEGIKPYLKVLTPLQTALGDFNDAHTALEHCRHWPASPDQRTSLAWLHHRQQQARAHSREALQAFMAQPLPLTSAEG